MTANVIYILGASHSGSTLLSMLLGNHPSCSTYGEMSAFDNVIRRNLPCTCGERVLDCNFWRAVMTVFAGDANPQSIPQLAPTDDRRATYAQGIARTRYLAAAAALTWWPWPLSPSITARLSPDAWQRATNTWRLYDSLSAVAGKAYLVDASKSMVRMKLLWSQRPTQVKVIYLTRCVRAVSASRTKRVHAASQPPAQKAKDWVRANQLSLAALRSLPQSAYYHVRYEALCRQPEATMAELLAYLELDYTPEIFALDSRKFHMIAGNPMRFSNFEAIREDVAWRSRLTQTELQEIERIAGKLNRELLGTYYEA